MANIHPTAIVGKNVVLGPNTEIGPYTVIEDNVQIGSDNKIFTRAYIASNTQIGDRNEIHMGVIIGHTPQDRAYQGAPTQTQIGNDNIIREYTTIHRGTKEGSSTVVGNNNYIMAYSHLAHNCSIGNWVTLVNGASLAGYCRIDDQAFLSGTTVFHQFTEIGRLAMVSGLSAINSNVPPFVVCGGRPAVAYGINVVGMRRANIAAPVRDEIKRAFKLVYRSGLNTSNALEEIENSLKSPEVTAFVQFIRNSKRGIISGDNTRESDEALRF